MVLTSLPIKILKTVATKNTKNAVFDRPTVV